MKVRNLPQTKNQPYSIHVKPVFALCVMGIAGIGLLLTRTAFAGLGVMQIVIAIFALLMMPDRILLQVSPEYLAMFNLRDPSKCTVVYWDEVVNWQYEYHSPADILALSLIDGSTQTIEMFSRRSVSRFMNLYAPGKEIRSSRRKEKDA